MSMPRGHGRPTGKHERPSTYPAAPLDAAAGLTLLELMVVLVILAIVATVAIEALQPRVDSQRFQSATRLLRNIQSATIGPQQKYQIDDTPLISGFVADVGRLPQSDRSLNETTGFPVLAELWDTDSQLAVEFPFQFRAGPSQPVDYSAVRIPCGWRGPYLQLPLGANSIMDPWGDAPEPVSGPNGQLQSLQITVPMTAEQIEPTVLSVDFASSRVDVTGNVVVDDPENTTIRVVLLGPDPGSSLTSLVVLDDEDEQPNSFQFRNVPIGLRAIAVESNGDMKIKYIQVPHSGLNVIINLKKQKTD